MDGQYVKQKYLETYRSVYLNYIECITKIHRNQFNAIRVDLLVCD